MLADMRKSGAGGNPTPLLGVRNGSEIEEYDGDDADQKSDVLSD